jgi:RNA polymerase sigma-70 factor, ECF subfamily
MNREILSIWNDLNQDLKKFIFGQVKNEAVCEDILQDVFIKIFLNINQLKDVSKLTAWIYQITRNSIVDYYRSQKLFETLDEVDLTLQEETQNSKLLDCIQSKINLLPDKYKDAVLLTTLEEYSQIELAKYLGISYSGAKSRVSRGKEQLKALVGQCKNVEVDENGRIMAHAADIL